MNYIIRKRTKDGNFKTLKEMPNISESIAKSVAAVLSCQKAHKDTQIFLVNDEYKHSILYFNGRRCREFKEDKLVYTSGDLK